MGANYQERSRLERYLGRSGPNSGPNSGVVQMFSGTPTCPESGTPPERGCRSAGAGGDVLAFFVPGIAKPEPRPRAAQNRKGVFVPDSADDWKDKTRAAAVAILGPGAVPDPDAAYSIKLRFSFERPKSHLTTGKNAGKLKPHAPRHCTKKPDFDNLEKALVDALGKWRDLPPLIWADDSQVVESHTTKTWAPVGTSAGCLVIITALP